MSDELICVDFDTSVKDNRGMYVVTLFSLFIFMRYMINERMNEQHALHCFSGKSTVGTVRQDFVEMCNPLG